MKEHKKPSPRGVLFIIACITAWSILIVYFSFPDPQGTDFYPIWVCAGEVLRGSSPYHQSVSSFLESTWEVTADKHIQAAAFCAYPLPFYVITAPFATIPFQAALLSWFLPALMIPIAFFTLDPTARWKACLPILYFPLFHAARIKTSTVLWLLLASMALALLRKGRSKTAAFLAVLLPAKPQVGLLLTGAVLYHLLKLDRRAFRYSLFGGLTLLLIPTAAFPEWPGDWVGLLTGYVSEAAMGDIIPRPLLIPTIVTTIIFLRKRSSFAVASALNLFVFPVNDLYTTAPLLFVWETFARPIALIGAAVSWLLPVVYNEPNNLQAIWLFLILPILAARAFEIVSARAASTTSTQSQISETG